MNQKMRQKEKHEQGTTKIGLRQNKERKQHAKGNEKERNRN